MKVWHFASLLFVICLPSEVFAEFYHPLEISCTDRGPAATPRIAMVRNGSLLTDDGYEYEEHERYEYSSLEDCQSALTHAIANNWIIRVNLISVYIPRGNATPRKEKKKRVTWYAQENAIQLGYTPSASEMAKLQRRLDELKKKLEIASEKLAQR